MEAITTTVGSLSDTDARAIVTRLTRPGSEFQQEVSNRDGSRTPIVLVRDGSWRIVSWAATHQWRGQQTLEGFTMDAYRRRGCQRAAAALLLASGAISTDRPVAIFSPLLINISHSLGFSTVRLYEFRDGDWRLNS